VPRKHPYVVAKSQDFIADPRQQEVAVPPGEIPPSDPVRKKNVPPEQNPLGFLQKTKRARTMARNLQHLKLDSRDLP
jgi:hypothetical protein